MTQSPQPPEHPDPQQGSGQYGPPSYPPPPSYPQPPSYPPPSGYASPPPYTGGHPGYPAPAPSQQYVAVPFKDTSGVNAVAGMVLGIIALLVSWIPIVGIIGWVVGGLGMLFSVLGFRQRNASQTMAIVGIVLNGIALLICLGYVALFVAALASGSSTSP